jgi:hypothetical protein
VLPSGRAPGSRTSLVTTLQFKILLGGDESKLEVMSAR